MKQKLRSIKKDDLSINDYILKIKTIGHSLAAIGEPLTDKDLLLAILNGLDHDYETVVSLIKTIGPRNNMLLLGLLERQNIWQLLLV